MKIGFIATEKYGPADEGWDNYLKWSKITQAKEIIGLDSNMCPCVIKELTNEDWNHVVIPEFILGIWDDLNYLLTRIGNPECCNILAVSDEPLEHEIKNFKKEKFEFLGFDLVEAYPNSTGISALTNCGGFVESFQARELSIYGLITDYARAFQIKKSLKENNPEESHANCRVWAIWRYLR